MEWGYLKEHPLKKIKQYNIDHLKNVRYLSKDEEKRLYTALNVRDDNLRKKRQSANLPPMVVVFFEFRFTGGQCRFFPTFDIRKCTEGHLAVPFSEAPVIRLDPGFVIRVNGRVVCGDRIVGRALKYGEVLRLGGDQGNRLNGG